MNTGIYVCFLALFCVANGKNLNAFNGVKYGYLFANQSSPYDCVKPQRSDLCSLDYDIFQFSGSVGAALVKAMYSSVNLTLTMLEKFKIDYTKQCMENLRHYACNNTFAKCSKDGGGIKVTYNVKETETACANVMANCPKIALEYLVYDCANINRNPMEWATCASLPDPGDNICHKNEGNNYKYPKASGKMYPEFIKLFSQGVVELKKYLTKECLEKFIDTTCQLQSGAICSNDQNLRMYAISRQDCHDVMDSCLLKLPDNVQDIYKMMCDVLPDATTAPKVPLPATSHISSNNSI